MRAGGGLWAARALGIAGLLAVWQVMSTAMGSRWIPGVDAVFARLVGELTGGGLWRDLSATTVLLLSGITAGAFLGASAACLLRLSSRIDQMVQPLITAVMSIPKLGLVPLLVLWFGTGWMPKMLLVTITSMFIVFSFTYSGLTTIDERLVMTARVFGASFLQVTRHVVLPTVWPFVLTGIAVALPWALSAALVGEYLAATRGIGHGIEQSRQVSDTVGIFYGIVLATLLVVAGNALLVSIRHLTTHHRDTEASA